MQCLRSLRHSGGPFHFTEKAEKTQILDLPDSLVESTYQRLLSTLSCPCESAH
uniref:Uncharacterized protein n=1 Tax=Oncorhynchus kisutch TaxID=8019 RepID=A0A8C7H5K0_ONCKI